MLGPAPQPPSKGVGVKSAPVVTEPPAHCRHGLFTELFTPYLITALLLLGCTSLFTACLPPRLVSFALLIFFFIYLPSNHSTYSSPAQSTAPGINMRLQLINVIITFVLMCSATLTFLREKAPRLASSYTPSKW